MTGGQAFIGEVARDTGLSIHTIWFYEARQLLPQAPRTQSGYRAYSAEDMEQLKFIKGAQELRFSLAEIRELAILRIWQVLCPVALQMQDKRVLRDTDQTPSGVLL